MGSSKYNLDNIDIDLFDELDDKEYEDSMDEPEFDEAELNLLMQRKYPVNLFAEEDYWVAEHPNLPGCSADGETEMEALANLQEIRKSVFIEMLAANIEIPGTEDKFIEDQYSGKILFRIPKKLQHKVTMAAKAEDMSINQKLIQLTIEGFNESVNSSNLDKISAQFEEICERLERLEGYSLESWIIKNKSKTHSSNSLEEVIEQEKITEVKHSKRALKRHFDSEYMKDGTRTVFFS